MGVSPVDSETPTTGPVLSLRGSFDGLLGFTVDHQSHNHHGDQHGYQ